MNKFSSLLDEPSADQIKEDERRKQAEREAIKHEKELCAIWRREIFKAETRAGLAQAEYELARGLEDACRVLAEQQQ